MEVLVTALLKVSVGVMTAMSLLLLNYNLRYFLAFTDDQTFWLYHFCVALFSLVPITAVFELEAVFPDAGTIRAVMICLFMIPTFALLMRQQQE
jgi:hypothetical protein